MTRRRPPWQEQQIAARSLLPHRESFSKVKFITAFEELRLPCHQIPSNSSAELSLAATPRSFSCENKSFQYNFPSPYLHFIRFCRGTFVYFSSFSLSTFFCLPNEFTSFILLAKHHPDIGRRNKTERSSSVPRQVNIYVDTMEERRRQKLFMLFLISASFAFYYGTLQD